jgi:hypothetical protein
MAATDQIRQMVNFILQEAHEKANEIRVKVSNSNRKSGVAFGRRLLCVVIGHSGVWKDFQERLKDGSCLTDYTLDGKYIVHTDIPIIVFPSIHRSIHSSRNQNAVLGISSRW